MIFKQRINYIYFMKFSLLSFQGQINRKNFIVGYFSSLAIFIIGYFLLSRGVNMHILDNSIFQPIFLMLFVIVLIIQLSLDIRRLHDIGNPGILTVLYLIPIVNFVFLLYLMIRKGNS